MAYDKGEYFQQSQQMGFRNAVNVTPSDTDDIEITKALYLGSSGDLKVDMADGSTVIFKSLTFGFMPLCVKRVYATGTTATDIVALY
jgi:hypothetical protein